MKRQSSFKKFANKDQNNASYWLNWAAALRGLRRTVAPYRVLQRGLCYEPNNADLQEALQQILAEMARPEAAERCIHSGHAPDEELKTSYLFSRQFLGIGTATEDSQALADQARSWEQQSQNQYLTTTLARHNSRAVRRVANFELGYLSADLANHPVGRFLLPSTQQSQPRARRDMGPELRFT